MKLRVQNQEIQIHELHVHHDLSDFPVTKIYRIARANHRQTTPDFLRCIDDASATSICGKEGRRDYPRDHVSRSVGILSPHDSFIRRVIDRRRRSRGVNCTPRLVRGAFRAADRPEKSIALISRRALIGDYGSALDTTPSALG